MDLACMHSFDLHIFWGARLTFLQSSTRLCIDMHHCTVNTTNILHWICLIIRRRLTTASIILHYTKKNWSSLFFGSLFHSSHSSNLIHGHQIFDYHLKYFPSKTRAFSYLACWNQYHIAWLRSELVTEWTARWILGCQDLLLQMALQLLAWCHSHAVAELQFSPVESSQELGDKI